MNDRDILQLVDDEEPTSIIDRRGFLDHTNSKSDVYNELYRGYYISIGIFGGSNLLPHSTHHYYVISLGKKTIYDELWYGNNFYTRNSCIERAREHIDGLFDGTSEDWRKG